MTKSKNINAKGRSKYNNDQYLKLSYGLLRHPNFRALNGSAVKVLLELCVRHNGFNNGKIVLSSDDGAKILHMSKATLFRAFADLEYYGFIKLKKLGRFLGRKASEWEVTFLSSEGYHPSHDWKETKKRLRKRKKKTDISSSIEDIVNSPESLEHRNLNSRY